MSVVDGSRKLCSLLPKLDEKLAGYLAAAGGLGVMTAQGVQAAVVAHTTPQSFGLIEGVNDVVNIDFNNDSQVDFQIDHDRVNLNGTDIDYLQLDKNDVNSAANPLPIDGLATFPNSSGHPTNNDHKYLTDGGEIGVDAGEYVAALNKDFEIGPTSTGVWEFQETTDFNGDGVPPQYVRRANRLIDEDHGQIDTALPPSSPIADPPPGTARFLGLNGATKYVGVAIDLQDAGYTENPRNLPTVNGPDFVDNPLNYWYGWIGIHITNEADATGEVVGYAYESQKGVSIKAGDVGTLVGVPGDYNNNNIVDAADYTLWRDKLGQAIALPNEGASPGVVDAADYTFWKSQFGGMGSGSANSVAAPEPGSLAMAAIGGVLVLGGFITRKLFASNRT